MVPTPPGGSRGGGRDGGQGEEEEEEVSAGDKEVEVIWMERKQMIVDMLVLPYHCCQNTDNNMCLRRWIDKPYFVKVVIEGILLQISNLIKGVFESQSLVVVVVFVLVVQILMGVVLYILNNKNTNTNTMNHSSTLFFVSAENGGKE